MMDKIDALKNDRFFEKSLYLSLGGLFYRAYQAKTQEVGIGVPPFAFGDLWIALLPAGLRL
jgi:hypothetical protein